MGNGQINLLPQTNRIAELFDLWGVARGRFFIAITMVVTVLLVLMEAQYNVDLLSTISDPNASKALVGDLSQRGKLLAAFGITWAIARGLLTSIRPFLFGMLIFASLTVGTYHGLDHIYTKVIADLKPEIKVKGFGLFSYRRDILTGKLIDSDIPLPKNEPVIGKIFMGAFPIVLLDDRFMLPVQDTIEVKAAYKGKEVLARADKEWPKYDTQMRELRIAHDKFVAESRRALDTTSIENEWKKYSAKMQELRNAYERFIDGSRKAARYGSAGTRRFREQSGGLSPNPNLTFHQFLSMLRSSSHPEGEKLRREESREIGQRANGKRVVVGHMPYSMGHAEFTRWVTNLSTESFKAKGFTPDPNITRTQFVEMLRGSKGTEGDKIRSADAKVITKRPDGSEVFLGELPYFLDHNAYLQWFSSQAEDARNNALPTVENVEKFSDIQDVNSAVFLPPMAIISSLTSALTNALTFVVVMFGLALSVISATNRAGEAIIRFSAPIMIGVFTALLYLMPSHVFNSGTPLFELETQLHENVGFAGKVWSRLSNLEKIILKE